MTQFQRMDARLDTLSTKLYQVNIRVNYIARRQAVRGGFIPEPSPPPPRADSEDEDDDDDVTASEDDGDGDASSFGTDGMSSCHSYPLLLVTKRGSSFGYENSHSQGESQYRTILLGGVLISKGCSEDYLYLFLFSTLDTFISCTWVL